jgi:hypothetical protein
MLEAMVQEKEHHFGDLIETIVRSRQFREIRGQNVELQEKK